MKTLYYPGGMLMPGRKYSAGTGYRYGFNGKENDNVVKGEGNQQDYGFRIYDTRIGKFLSIDPLTQKYPMLTPYQFASNRPIDGIDQDGLEWCPSIPTFEYKGTIESNPVENVPAAAVNAVISIINIVPAIWNSGVQNVQAIHNGTWKEGVSKELSKGYNNTSDAVYNSVNDAVKVPIKQQVINFGNFLNNPQTLETGITFALPFGISKLKVLNAAEEGVMLKPYGGPGGGHHVPAKSAFIGATGYDVNTALAIPNAELARLGIDHGLITGAQMQGYKAFAKTSATLTWEAMATIETQALIRGSMKPAAAKIVVNEAINGLKKAGVAAPTRIPWGGK